MGAAAYSSRVSSTDNTSLPSTAGARPATKGGRGTRVARSVWVGRILSSLAVLFLVFDAVVKVASSSEALKGTSDLGFPLNVVIPLGVLELVLCVLYLIPRTAILGAVLWTGYLGGAVAAQVRVGNPIFSHVLFPVYVAALVWGGLWLRDRRVRALLAARD
jgi:hypothetical protein